MTAVPRFFFFNFFPLTRHADGQEALDKVKESMELRNPYNLIFMDVQVSSPFPFDAPLSNDV